jgi:MYXO-CTERM domain-containing protein
MRVARPLAWTVVVLFLGSMYFGVERTGALLLPILQPLASPTGVPAPELHVMLRKAAHVIVYATLGVLWFQVLARRRRAVVAGWIALSLCVTCAVVDEAHQARLPNRTPSARDVAIDAAGAAAALGAACRRRRRRETQGMPLAARLPYVRVA